MIENMVPGTYYFFLGEESAVHKNMPHGSLHAIQSNPQYFTKFKRLISFDRKEKGQLVTRQLGKSCCSDSFADSLINEFKSKGIEYKKDKTGYYTDGAFFSQLIPEIVNLSAGVYNEHTVREYIDISYTEKIARASISINWESLPVERVVDSYVLDPREDMEEIDLTSDQYLFSEVNSILDNMYFVCHEVRNYKSYLYHFKPGRVYNFSKWHDDENLTISINNGVINCNGTTFTKIEDFKKYLGISKLNRKELLKSVIDLFVKKNNNLTMAELDTLIYQKEGDLKKLSKDLRKNRLKLVSTGKGYKLTKESYINTYIGFKIK